MHASATSQDHRRPTCIAVKYPESVRCSRTADRERHHKRVDRARVWGELRCAPWLTGLRGNARQFSGGRMKVELLRVRPAVRAIEAGMRFARAHGRTVHRARALCATADMLQLRRPRDWMRRAERLYGRAARDLHRVIFSGSKMPVVEPPDPEPVERRAYRLLYLAQASYRRMALATGAVVSVVLLALVIVIWVGSAISPAFRARVFPRDLAARRPWVASSAVASHARNGIDPSSKGPGPFFHTEPSDHPWIEIDLGAPRVM